MLKKTLNTFHTLIKNKQVEKQSKSRAKSAPLKSLPRSFLFVHIPKTAGTSFRKSAEEQYPTLGDYGKESFHTSDSVKEYCYKQQDMYALQSVFNNENQIFSGHFLSQKYLDFVDTRHIISFVRDPLEQVVSHYNHSVTHLAYEGDFNDFIIMPRHCNIQSRYLNALPVSLYGFIGLTANYEESLGFINKNFGLEIDFKQDNVGQQKIQTKQDLTPEQCEVIAAHNSQDVLLLNQVEALFIQRLAYQNNKQVWVHSFGYINLNNLLVGCAYFEQSDEAVQLELFINNKLANQFTANQFTGLYAKAKLPRARYIGFHVNLNNFKHATHVQIKVKETGQSVFEQKILKN
jgi:hypothetical protein